MNRRVITYLSLGGLLGPVLFTTLTLLCSSLRSHYDHLNQFISELGATQTSNAKLMNNAGFIPSGLMITFFGSALLLSLPKSVLNRLGAILVSFFGIGMMLAGFFSCDPGCPQEGGSSENLTHNMVSGPAFVSMVIGLFLLSFVFRNSLVWRRLWIYSIVSAFLAAVFLVLLIISIESKTLTGLWQRLLLTTIFLWLSIISIKLFKLNHSSPV